MDSDLRLGKIAIIFRNLLEGFSEYEAYGAAEQGRGEVAVSHLREC